MFVDKIMDNQFYNGVIIVIRYRALAVTLIDSCRANVRLFPRSVADIATTWCCQKLGLEKIFVEIEQEFMRAYLYQTVFSFLVKE